MCVRNRSKEEATNEEEADFYFAMLVNGVYTHNTYSSIQAYTLNESSFKQIIIIVILNERII